MARRVVLYIAMSLDGYIADRQGGVGWLTGHDGAVPSDEGYEAFIAGIDTVVMGYRTYRQIVEELTPGHWPYEGMRGYVASGQARAKTAHVSFIGGDIVGFVQGLRGQEGKDIWLVGGADLVESFIQADAIDVYQITIIPTILGSGVRLFGAPSSTIPLQLQEHKTESGMLMLQYTKNPSQ